MEGGVAGSLRGSGSASAGGATSGGKKMKKRKELDALVAHTVSKRTSSSTHEHLLTDSSDEWTASGGAAAAAVRCRRRGRGVARRRMCVALGRACCALLVLTCAVATTTVMWLFIDVRQQVTSLRSDLNQVVAAHQGVPDALQECHSLSRELHNNQSVILTKLAGFSLLLGNFSANLSDVRAALSAVQQQLKNSPNLVNDPRLVKDLSDSVARFGSKIQDLETTAAALKEQATHTEGVVTSLSSNVTSALTQVAGLAAGLSAGRGGVSAADLAAQREAVMAAMAQIAANLTAVNVTLTNKLQWTADDQARDHKAVESLEEMNQNVTARLKTLEGGLCSKATTPPLPPSSAPPAPPDKQTNTPPLGNAPPLDVFGPAAPSPRP